MDPKIELKFSVFLFLTYPIQKIVFAERVDRLRCELRSSTNPTGLGLFCALLTLFTYSLKTETEHKTNELYNKILIKLDFGCTKMIKPNEGKKAGSFGNFRPFGRAHQVRSKLVELRKTCKS